MIAEIDQPEFVAADLLATIHKSMAAHPRSRQTVIGPSELGHPCPRWLLERFNGDKQPPGTGVRDGWLAQIGTSTHVGLRDMFDGTPRYVTEHRVEVGTVGGTHVFGNCDLYDRESLTVIDWKCVGQTRLAHYQRHGPGDQYRIQIHLYARGLVAAGLPVRTVMIMFLPRNAGLDKAFPYFDDYRPEVAEAALARADGLATLLRLQGISAAKANYPLCDDQYCHYCQTDRPPPPIPTTKQLLLSSR